MYSTKTSPWIRVEDPLFTQVSENLMADQISNHLAVAKDIFKDPIKMGVEESILHHQPLTLVLSLDEERGTVNNPPTQIQFPGNSFERFALILD